MIFYHLVLLLIVIILMIIIIIAKTVILSLHGTIITVTPKYTIAPIVLLSCCPIVLLSHFAVHAQCTWSADLPHTKSPVPKKPPFLFIKFFQSFSAPTHNFFSPKIFLFLGLYLEVLHWTLLTLWCFCRLSQPPEAQTNFPESNSTFRLQPLCQYLVNIYWKGKAIPVTGRGGL
jgi:hypothetical protein